MRRLYMREDAWYCADCVQKHFAKERGMFDGPFVDISVQDFLLFCAYCDQFLQHEFTDEAAFQAKVILDAYSRTGKGSHEHMVQVAHAIGVRAPRVHLRKPVVEQGVQVLERRVWKTAEQMNAFYAALAPAQNTISSAQELSANDGEHVARYRIAVDAAKASALEGDGHFIILSNAAREFKVVRGKRMAEFPGWRLIYEYDCRGVEPREVVHE